MVKRTNRASVKSEKVNGKKAAVKKPAKPTIRSYRWHQKQMQEISNLVGNPKDVAAAIAEMKDKADRVEKLDADNATYAAKVKDYETSNKSLESRNSDLRQMVYTRDGLIAENRDKLFTLDQTLKEKREYAEQLTQSGRDLSSARWELSNLRKSIQQKEAENLNLSKQLVDAGYLRLENETLRNSVKEALCHINQSGTRFYLSSSGALEKTFE